MNKRLTAVLFFLFSLKSQAQANKDFADSIRLKYIIPELAYAVVSSDSILELQIIGVQRINTSFTAKPNDRFHIGSNTKAITAFIAALLVQQEKIRWNTKFIDLFPELKSVSKKVYLNITLQDLLTFRGKLPPYTYSFNKPSEDQITGNDSQQRFLLAKYFLSQKPMKAENNLTPSNVDYILAGLMLEKAAKKSYKELVADFGKKQGIFFGFDYPNLSDTLQPWGHDKNLKPLPPLKNYKLNWLLSAGNINISLPDYVLFIQFLLQGLKGETSILSRQTFDTLLYRLPTFSFGWFNSLNILTNHHVAFNEGNAGAFITQVQIIKEINRAYIIFTNSATKATADGVSVLLNQLKKKYGE